MLGSTTSIFSVAEHLLVNMSETSSMQHPIDLDHHYQPSGLQDMGQEAGPNEVDRQPNLKGFLYLQVTEGYRACLSNSGQNPIFFL